MDNPVGAVPLIKRGGQFSCRQGVSFWCRLTHVAGDQFRMWLDAFDWAMFTAEDAQRSRTSPPGTGTRAARFPRFVHGADPRKNTEARWAKGGKRDSAPIEWGDVLARGAWILRAHRSTRGRIRIVFSRPLQPSRGVEGGRAIDPEGGVLPLAPAISAASISPDGNSHPMPLRPKHIQHMYAVVSSGERAYNAPLARRGARCAS